MRLPILRGVYATTAAELAVSYPINREPVVLESGLSKGFLRTAPGIAPFAVASGADRGGTVWNGVHYRVIGNSFVLISPSGTVSTLGTVQPGGACAFDIGFDRIAINAGTALYYYNGATLTQVTDINLGTVNDMLFLSGYYVTIDSKNIVVTNLTDPTTVNPLRYGGSETDPTGPVALFKQFGELCVLNRYTTDFYYNAGGTGFPFQVNTSAGFARGCIGRRARCAYLETFAFVGGGTNEAVGVYLGGNGTSNKLSTKEIDDALAALSPTDLAAVELESRVEHDEQRLILHLPAQSFVFYQAATKSFGEKVWGVLTSGLNGDQPYRGRHAVYAYGKWMVGDATGNIGVLSTGLSTHFGTVTGWRFDTPLLHAGQRFILLNIGLIGLPGNAPFGVTPSISLSLTENGRDWGQERWALTGQAGDFNRNVQWRPRRRFSNFAGLRFRGADAGMMPIADLDVNLEVMEN